MAEKYYLLTKYFFQEELYEIVQQSRKSAVSISARWEALHSRIPQIY
ncbi:four helix bundle protein [Stanieria cyanosphaera]